MKIPELMPLSVTKIGVLPVRTVVFGVRVIGVDSNKIQAWFNGEFFAAQHAHTSQYYYW